MIYFKNYSTDKHRNKFAVDSSLKIPWSTKHKGM